MKKLVTFISFAFMLIYMSSCNQSPSANKVISFHQLAVDTELADFINKIRAVDNHAHPNSWIQMIKTCDKLFSVVGHKTNNGGQNLYNLGLK